MLVLLLAATLPLTAQTQPEFRGATINLVRSSGDLHQQIVSLGAGSEKVWVAYTIPASRTRRMRVCCSLDDDDMNISTYDSELAEDVVVLYRVRNGEIASIRAVSSCTLSAYGATIDWLQGVDPRASVSMLATLAKGNTQISKKAIFALSLHDDAVDALIDLAHHGERAKTRTDALFWLAQTAAVKAAGVLRDAVDSDPDDEVRSKAVFGIAQLPNDQSIPLLDELMRTHRSAAVRKKAAFWLGQKNDPRALAAIESYIRR